MELPAWTDSSMNTRLPIREDSVRTVAGKGG
jgi:hypothetical protein